MRQAYLDLQEKHRKEINEFPMAYAFSEKQLAEALEELGATKEECTTVFGHGDVMKKEDAPKFLAMLERHDKEMKDAMLDENFAEAAFRYEMDNHEYAINWDGDDEVLACFGMKVDDLLENGLKAAYMRARKGHMEYAKEWM